MRRLGLVVLVGTLASCGSDDVPPGDAGSDAGGVDSGGTDSGGTDSGGTDSGGIDSGGMDAGMDAGAVDGGPGDAGKVPDGGAVAPMRVAGGTRHTCAVLSGGGVKCWGSGVNGALGYGNEADIGRSDTPADHGTVDIGGSAMGVAAGFGFSCALRTDGNVVCWGATAALGYASTEHVGDDEVPSVFGTIDVGGDVAQIRAGGFHICVLLTSGDFKCWGSNGRGQLGRGNTEPIGDDEHPSSIGALDLGSPVVDYGCGFDYSCALLASGDVRCWGFGERGRLGSGSTENIGDDEPPTSISPVDVGAGTVVDISVGGGHSCVLFDDGGLTCWGLGLRGALGYGNTVDIGDDETPASAGRVDLGGAATAVWAQAHNTCAQLADGTLRCWGLGSLGSNGYGNTDNIGDDELPSAVAGVDLGSTLLELSEGDDAEHWCALTPDGLRCWGANQWGQLGLGIGGNVGDDELPSTVAFVPL